MSISYIITTYNRPHSLLLRAMESVVAERIGDESELIVVDDCSAIPAYIDEHIADAFGGQVKLIRNPENRGVIRSRNAGLEAAKHPFLLYLDDDDVAFPNRTHDLLGAIEGTPHAYAGARTIKKEGEHSKTVPEAFDFDATPLLQLLYPPHLNGVIWRRDALTAMGGMDNRVPYFGEHITMVLMLLRGASARQISEVVAEFQYQPDGLTWQTSRQNLMQQRLTEMYQVFARENPDGKFGERCQEMLRYLENHQLADFEEYLSALSEIMAT